MHLASIFLFASSISASLFQCNGAYIRHISIIIVHICGWCATSYSRPCDKSLTALQLFPPSFFFFIFGGGTLFFSSYIPLFLHTHHYHFLPIFSALLFTFRHNWAVSRLTLILTWYWPRILDNVSLRSGCCGHEQVRCPRRSGEMADMWESP